MLRAVCELAQISQSTLFLACKSRNKKTPSEFRDRLGRKGNVYQTRQHFATELIYFRPASAAIGRVGNVSSRMVVRSPSFLGTNGANAHESDVARQAMMSPVIPRRPPVGGPTDGIICGHPDHRSAHSVHLVDITKPLKNWIPPPGGAAIGCLQHAVGTAYSPSDIRISRRNAQEVVCIVNIAPFLAGPGLAGISGLEDHGMVCTVGTSSHPHSVMIQHEHALQGDILVRIWDVVRPGSATITRMEDRTRANDPDIVTPGMDLEKLDIRNIVR
ncbi:MAG: hypothetical protein PHZ02_02040 [Desulfocapsaceae bacterium]|nr:hypothetical protein [Desulfocapsaceae bacterium]